MIAILHDDLLAICRQPSQFGLPSMYAYLVKRRAFLYHDRVAGLPILS